MALGTPTVGTANQGTNGNPDPGIPTGSVGDLLIAIVGWRGSTTTMTATGWTAVTGAPWRHASSTINEIRVFTRIADGTEGATVTLTKTGGGTGQTFNSFVIRVSGADTTTPINVIGTKTDNASAQNIGPITGITPTTAGSAVLVLAHKATFWTSVATLTGDSLTWSELAEPQSSTGNDGGTVADWATGWTSGAITSKTFTVTGGVSNTAVGLMLAVQPSSAAAIDLVVANAAHAHTSANAALVQQHNLAVADSTLGHAGQSFALSAPLTGDLVRDTFDRANAGTLGTADFGGSWTAASGTWSIVGNKAQRTAGADPQNSYATIDPGTANVDIRCDITLSPSYQRANAGINFRVTGANDYLFIKIEATNTNNRISLMGNKGGVGSHIIAFDESNTWVNGDTYRLRVTALGNDIKVYANDTLYITHTLTGADITDYTGTPCGPRLRYGVSTDQEDDGGSLFDNFEVFSSAITTALVVDNAGHGHSATDVPITKQSDLVVADASHAHVAEQATVTASSDLVVQNAAHLNRAGALDGQPPGLNDVVPITQQHILVVAGAIHAHVADTAAITKQSDVVVAGATHAHTADAVPITKQSLLVVQDAAHAHIADNVAVTASTSLVIADAAHAHNAENVALIQQHILTVAAAVHAHAAEAFALLQQHILAVAAATHAHVAQAPGTMVQNTVLVLADAIHAQSAGAPTLVVNSTLVVADATHLHSAPNVAVSSGGTLGIADATHGHTADPPALAQQHILTVADGSHAHVAGMPVLATTAMLVIQAAVHGHESSNVALALPLELVVASSSHAHTSDEMLLTQRHVLVIADSFHAHIAHVVVLAYGRPWQLEYVRSRPGMVDVSPIGSEQPVAQGVMVSTTPTAGVGIRSTTPTTMRREPEGAS